MPTPPVWPPQRRALMGALGAVAPDVVLFYSKRFTMPALAFSVGQYIAASVLYLGLAAVVAVIFPYPGRRTDWKAFCVGVALPIIVAGAASFVTDPAVGPRGAGLAGTLLDLMAIR